MNKKRFIVSEIILAALAVLLILSGYFYSNITKLFTKTTNPNTLGADDVGKTFTFSCIDNMVITDEDDLVLNYEDSEYYFCYYTTAPSNLKKAFKSRCLRAVGTYNGILREADGNIRGTAITALDDYFLRLSEMIEGYDYANDTEMQDALHESVSNYYIEVVSLNGTPSTVPQVIIYITGAVLLLAFVIRFIAHVSKVPALKITAVTAGIIVLAAGIIAVIAFDKIRTILSVKEEGSGIYSMTFYGDLKIDKLLSSDISTIDGLAKWISDEQLYGLPLQVDTSGIGCATFSCNTPDGDTLFGRNFDFWETDTVVIYTDPSDGYASYGLADLTILGLGEFDIDPVSPEGRAYLLAEPYLCFDGVNEEGLAVGILEIEIGELQQNNGKPDLLIYCAIRAILDKCANVDEAVALLKNYDIHTSVDDSFHLQIVDRSGRSVVVEWIDGQMEVNGLYAATNSVLTPGEHFDEGSPDGRIDVLLDTLEKKGRVMTVTEARDLLDSVSQEDFTEWSCIYNLDKFGVYVYVDEDFSKAYVFGES